MIILNATDQSLEVTLGESATTELDINVSYISIATNVYTPVENNVTTNDTNAVEIVPAPSTNYVHQIKFLSVNNTDNISHVVFVRKKVGATTKVLTKVNLDEGATLQYADGEGFSIISKNSEIKNVTVPQKVISAGTRSVSEGTIFFSNSNQVSFAITNDSQIVASYTPIKASYFAAQNNRSAFTFDISTQVSYNLSIQRFVLPYELVVTRMEAMFSIFASGSNGGTLSGMMGIYTRTGSTLSMGTASSASSSLGFATGGATSVSSAYSGVSGVRHRTLGLNSIRLTPGEYWYAQAWGYTTSGNTRHSLAIYANSALGVGGVPGGDNDSIGLYGIYTTITTAMPSSVPFSDIHFCATNTVLSALVNRQPWFALYGTYNT